MDTSSSKQSLFWRLMFIFCIYVPGMTFDARGSSTASAVTTIGEPTTASVTSSLLRKSMDDQTLPRAQLSTLTTIRPTTPTTTTTIYNSPKTNTITTGYKRSSPTTAAAAATITIDAASEIKATNVSFSTGTKDSLSPSPTTTNASTKAAKKELTTSSLSTSATAAAAAAVAALTSTTISTAAAASTRTVVTKDSLWTTDVSGNNDAHKTSNNGEQGTIIGNKTNSIKTKNNNNNSYIEISQMLSDNSSVSDKTNNNEFKQTFQLNALSFKQFVQKDFALLNSTKTEITANVSNNFVVVDGYDKKMQLNEMPINEKLMMATTTVIATTIELTASSDEDTSEVAKISPGTVATTTVSLPSSLTLGPVEPTAMNTSNTATSSSTTTTTTTTTTTSKPLLPLAVDGYQTIISQAGTHAYLPCNVKQLVKKPISWLRVRDGHILTVDQTTFIADQRFQSIYTPNPERWSLQIKFVQTKDAGTYECQVSTEPKTSAIVTLIIIEPKTELIGEATRHVKAGSEVKLRCIISQALEPPVFINWFFNQKQIYLNNRRGWRTEIERIETTSSTDSPPLTVDANKSGTETSSTLMLSNNELHSSMSLSVGKDRATAKLLALTERATATKTSTVLPITTTTAATDVRQITTASLIIPSVEKQDSGNYTCSPSNSAPMTVVLHVLNGEFSASAITSGVYSNLVLISYNIGGIRLYHWHNATIVLILFWLLCFLHSIKFGKMQNSSITKYNEERSNYSRRCVLTTCCSDVKRSFSMPEKTTKACSIAKQRT